MRSQAGTLTARSVGFAYPAKAADSSGALVNISLRIAPEDFVVAVGASGCGKSTLLKLLAGFLKPGSGEIRFDNRLVDGPSRKRGVVFQDDALFPWLDVTGNIQFGLRLAGIPAGHRASAASRIAADVGLAGLESRKIWELSGGMRQRVGLARALVNDPDILLMDEPFGALDALTRERMQELLLTLWSRSRKGVFLITHSIEEAVLLGTEILVMAPRPGRIVQRFSAAFSKRFAAGEPIQSLRSDPDFAALREAVRRAVLEDAGA